MDPGYEFTVNRFFGQQVLAALPKAPKKVQVAYALMKRPPKYQLYDLQMDPYEFVNLAKDPAHRFDSRRIIHRIDALASGDSTIRMLNQENIKRLERGD